jgi:iron complex transport system substrate-binding protein
LRRPAIFLASLLASAHVLGAVSAVDSAGRRVTLPAPAQRIVSLAPHVTELLFAAGAGSKVVAVSEYSDYPEAAKKLPQVASSATVDLERVLALRADLAIAWRLSATAQSLDRLQAIGVPVFYSEPQRLADIADQVEALGTLAGTVPQARQVAADLRGELGRLRREFAGRPTLKVFYEISERPLMTINGRQMISDALEVCGARNVFADASIIAPVVSAEAVLAADPDVVVAALDDPADTTWSAFWRKFPGLRATRTDNFITLRATDMNRQGPRAIAATRVLCGRLEEARRRALR